MASPNSTFTELVTTTLREHPNEIADNVSDHNALYNRLNKKSKVKRALDGGTEIVEPLDYAENGTFQRYSGYDTLNIEASDVLSAAKYDWVQSAVSVVASGRELRINSGKNQIINLMKARTKNAIRTAANNMSVDIYSSGSLTNQMGGLGHLIQTDGAGTVGGIVASTYTFWKNKFKEVTGTNDPTDLKADMLTLWLSMVRGTDKPDLIVSTHDFYSEYWDQLSDIQRYKNNDTPDTFQSLKFQSADVMFDSNDNFSTTGEKMYFLNTDYLSLRYHPDANWTPLEEKTSVNQDAAVVTMIWQGQMTCSNRAAQGVLFDAS
jgi:hypothetical protein